MQIVELDGAAAVAEQEGVRRNIRVDFVPDAGIGDYVLVHAGIAIEQIDEEQARETLASLRLLLGDDNPSQVRSEGADSV